MSEQKTNAPPIGGEKFWKLYDAFCQPDHLERYVMDGDSELGPRMRSVMKEAHQAGDIHCISRPKRGWTQHKAWLVLRTTLVPNIKGEPVLRVRVGDVVVVERGWDRDVFVTHHPIHEQVKGYLLSGAWDEMVGLFMPLFDRRTIFTCIDLRTAKNVSDAFTLAGKEAHDWQWPVTAFHEKGAS